MTDEYMSQRFNSLLPIVLDIETGGVNYQTDALLELAAVSLQFNDKNQLKQKGLFSHHIKPFKGARLDPKALAVNHINPYHPFRFAISEKEMLTKLFQFINKEVAENNCKRAVLVGHNAHFDLYFLQEAIKRCKMISPFHAFTVFDTATLSGLMYGKTVLAHAVKASGMGFDKEQAHSAIYDAKITAQLFCQIINKFPYKSSA